MKEEPKWIPLSEIEFNDSITYLRFDTRDFHAIVNLEGLYEPANLDQLAIVNKKNKLLFTIEEVKNIIYRFFNDSGGNKGWRFLSLNDKGRGLGWFKYFSVFKTKHGYVFKCREEESCLYEYELLSEVNKENLHDH
jgi:hypothetical protein